MSRRAWLPPLAAVVGYVAVAVVFSWPLLPNLSTHLTGDPGGDTGVYVWNQWVFQHEAVAERRNPLTTEHIFSLTGRPVDLTQHNYTLFANTLALPLIERLGPVATFNVVYLVTVVLTAFMTFVLARRVTDGATFEAWLAGLAFAWSPVLVARSTGHFSLVAAAPLAAFLWCLYRVERSERLSDSLLAGLCIAWAGACDAYYSVYCVVIASVYVASRLLRLEWRPQWRHGAGVWLLDLCIVLAAGLVVGLVAGRGGRFELLGVPVSVRGLHSPVLLLSLLVLARVVHYLHPQVLTVGLPRWRSVALAAAAGLAGIVALSPTLYGAATRMMDGTWVSPPTYWRSSPRGVDLLALVAPNPSHPFVRSLIGYEQDTAPTVFVEFTAAVGLVALAVIVVAVWRAGFSARGWFWTAGIFALLSLGPFIHVGGVNTLVPGPWALLRYVPVVNLTRMPGRFAIVAALCVSVLFALALRALSDWWPTRRRQILATVAALLAFELLPAPRPLYSAAVPDVYTKVRDDERPVRLLELPFGVRDGVSSEGDFSARYQFNQTVHGKRLIGGYLSRVSTRRFREIRSSPMLAGLLRLSEGQTLAPSDVDTLVAAGPAFVEGAQLAWVVIHPSRSTPALVRFAERAFDLERVAIDGDAVLYRTRAMTISSVTAAAVPHRDGSAR
jgi:hypothetical protein